ncbi:unnamed protein product [Durusdinium trenchii]
MDVFEDGAMLDGGRQLLFKREIENGVVLTTSVAADICCPRAVHVRGQLCQTFHFCSCSLRKVKRKPTDTCELPLKDLKTTSNRHSKLKKTSAQSLKLRFLVLWGFVQFALFVVRTNRARAPWPPGALCSRCSDLKKAEVKGAFGIRPEDLEDEAEPAGGSEDERSEADLQSEAGETAEEAREGIQKLLEETGRTLQRGRTLAMKEAISAARQHGVESSLIKEAQQRLEHHQLRQKRAECEKEVSLWFASAAQDLEQCGRLLEAAVQSQCAEEIQAKLRKRLEELKITRPLAPDELDQAQRYVTESCQGFVSAALLAEGRKTLFLDLDEGNKSTATLHLNPSLQVLSLKVHIDEGTKSASAAHMQQLEETWLKDIDSLPAKDDEVISQHRGFLELECQVNGRSKVWCFVEASLHERDRLLQALHVLSCVPEPEGAEEWEEEDYEAYEEG